MRQSVGWGKHAPDHDAARRDAKIDTQTENLSGVLFRRRAVIGIELAVNSLMRSEDQTKPGGGLTLQHADLRAALTESRQRRYGNESDEQTDCRNA
jgi:hypothetical protein